MKSNTAKFKKSDKMNVRDYITAAILYVLMFLVYAGVGAPHWYDRRWQLVCLCGLCSGLGNHFHASVYESE